MGFFSKVGNRLVGAVKMGGRFLSSAAKVGGRIATGAASAMDAAGRIPLVGGALNANPVFQGLRGIVGGVARTSNILGSAGKILERPPSSVSGLRSAAGRLKNIAGAARKEGRETLAAGRNVQSLAGQMQRPNFGVNNLANMAGKFVGSSQFTTGPA